MKLKVANRGTYIYTGGRVFDTTRPTAVFIHGAGHDHSVWTLQSRYFASHGWNAVVPDLPSHGQSEGPQRDSIESLSDWVLALLDALAIDKAFLAGHSMGSLVALQAASSAPNRVSGAALVGSVVPMPVAPALLESTLATPDKAHRMINQWSYAASSQLGASSTPGVNLTAVNERLMQRQATGVLHHDMAACNKYEGGFDAAARVTCPVLLLSASQDRMTPPKAIAPLASALAATTTVKQVIVPAAGHAMMAERPSQVLDALWQFATSIASKPTP